MADQEKILQEVQQLGFISGSSLGTTLLFRKLKWSPLETAISIMVKHNILVDLSLGPLDFPYDNGVRIPKLLQIKLAEELISSGTNHISLSMKNDPVAPNSSRMIRNYSFEFLHKLLKIYGKDARIRKFYIANEWPDKDNIEEMDTQISAGTDYMIEVIKLVRGLTSKPLAINTNIHPSNSDEIKIKLGPVLDQMGDQAVLGLDTYYTEEKKDFYLNLGNLFYSEHIKALHKLFPKPEIVFTEFQAEPWPSDGLLGQSWSDIYDTSKEMFRDFYEYSFPKSLKSHLIPSGIREIGLWGAPAIIIAKMKGYDFPARLIKSISGSMAKS